MSLTTIMQTFYNNGKFEEQNDFFESVSFLKDIKLSDLNAQQTLQFEQEVVEELQNFAESVITELAAKTNDDTRKHWVIAAKSGFKESVIQKYPDIAVLMSIVMKRYYTKLINQYIETHQKVTVNN